MSSIPRGDNNLINIKCVKGGEEGNYKRVPRFQARPLVDSGGYKYVTNQEYRAAIKKTKKSAPKPGKKINKNKLSRAERREMVKKEKKEKRNKFHKRQAQDQKKKRRRKEDRRKRRSKRRRGSKRNKEGEI